MEIMKAKGANKDKRNNLMIVDGLNLAFNLEA